MYSNFFLFTGKPVGKQMGFGQAGESVADLPGTGEKRSPGLKPNRKGTNPAGMSLIPIISTCAAAPTGSMGWQR
jgi:hypothetical protein